MKTAQKLAFIAIGGVLVATGMIISPLNAQKDKFGEIECTKLTVVDDGGTPRVILITDIRDYSDHVMDGKEAVVLIYASEYSGNVSVLSRDNEGGSATLRTHGSRTGSVTVYGKNGNASVEISSEEFGGRVNITNSEGYHVGTFKANPNGGHVAVHDGGDTKGMAILSGGEDGGFVELSKPSHKTQAKLHINEWGGRLQLNGKGEGAVLLGINEYGYGVVSTYDKNGYHLK